MDDDGRGPLRLRIGDECQERRERHGYFGSVPSDANELAEGTVQEAPDSDHQSSRS